MHMTKSKQKHVLLVEDDDFLAQIYVHKLETEGFKVSHEDAAMAGLEDARRKKPDIILLDVLMPRLDGFSVLHELKRDHKTKKIPVLMLTNLGQKEDVEKGLSLGAADYLIKAHTTPSEVVSHINTILKKK